MVFSKSLSRYWLAVGSLLISTCQVQAESVAVRAEERGQGYIFSHEEHCYLITARHVAGKSQRAQVIAEGSLTGTSSLRFPFWDGIDLAVGIVRREAAERCSGSLTNLSSSVSSIGQRDQTQLFIIDDEGLVDRLSMDITETRYLDFDARFSGDSSDALAQKGMSGGFLFGDGRPIGMAVEAIDERTIRFIRVEEIYLNVARWIEMQVQIGTGASSTSEVGTSVGLPLEVISVSNPAVDAEHLPENMLTDAGSYIFDPKSTVEIIFGVPSDPTATLSAVRILAVPEEGRAVPRRVIVFTSPDAEGERWRTFWAGEMSRDGVLDTGARAQSWARRLKVVAASAWSEGEMKIDQVIIK